jgi:hypothetical protein
VIRFARSTLTIAGLALLPLGCDALVGGICSVGYAYDGDTCVPAPKLQAGSIDRGSSGGAGGASSSSSTSTSSGAGGDAPCGPGLTRCEQLCVDLMTDPLHCGTCETACNSGVCTAGACAILAGHAVAIGASYQGVAPASPAAVVLGNAVFLSKHEPLRLLDYRAHAAMPSVQTVEAVLKSETSARGRKLKRTVLADEGKLSATLSSGLIDVFFVHDESQAPPGALASLGSAWSAPLKTYLDSGGIVVVLATHAGTGEMSDFLSESGLFETTSVDDITGEMVTNRAWLDAVGQNVPSPFAAPYLSASFQTSDQEGPSLSFVLATASTSAPFAMHKVWLP